MCGLILLLFGIFYAFRIPKFLKSTPAEYPNADPELHARWRAKELMSIYVFLGATWGITILGFIVGFGLGLAFMGNQESLAQLGVMVSGVMIAGFLGGLVWSAILGSQAKEMRKRLGMAATMVPGYYPRPGQPQMPMPPPPSDERNEE